MRRIKLGKGLIRSLFLLPSSSSTHSSKKKKKSSSATSPPPASSSHSANGNSILSSALQCPKAILGGHGRKDSLHPYELHQEGASLPPTSEDECRDLEDSVLGSRMFPQRQEADVSSPITVACTSSHDEERQDEQLENFVAFNKMAIEDEFEAVSKEATALTQQEEEAQQCLPKQQQKEQVSFHNELPDHLQDEARRRAFARRQRILSTASTRFQAIAETASIDTSEDYLSPLPHRRLFKMRQQLQKDRQTIAQEVSFDNMNNSLHPHSEESSAFHSTRLTSTKNQQPNKNFSSIIFYDITTTTNNTTSSQNNENEPELREEDVPSPVCVADMVERFGGGGCNKGVLVTHHATAERCSSSNNCTSTENTYNNIHFFILCLCPYSRIFEIAEVSDAPLHSTIGDILKLIPRHVTDERLLEKNYVGLCRPADRTEFIDRRRPAFLARKPNRSEAVDEDNDEDCIPFDYIHESDVLVAILKGSSCYQMSKVSKPILRHPKFKEMIRRRRRRSDAAANNATRKKRRKSKKKATTSMSSPTNEIYVHDDCSVVSGITACATKEAARQDPMSLCKMLEVLSKKLHEVDNGDVLVPDENSSMASVNSGLTQMKRRATIETSSNDGQRNQIGFKISPKMLAMELAQTIEDIFADNNVEIVAVDADGDDGNDDDGNETFVSAMSHRTKSTVATLRSMGFQSTALPKHIVTVREKTKNATREYKFAETIEDNALAAQIEAMAAQADAAFEDRRKKDSSRVASKMNETVDKMISTSNKEAQVTYATSPLAEASTTEVDVGTQDVEESFETTFEALPNIECEGMMGAAMVTYGANQKGSVARNFLNASTTTVTKMVAANQGRVNEVHVLQSLGCTIVCIAANYMHQAQQSGRSQLPMPKPSGVFQSAVFLAFMVNGQKYLAKITNREGVQK